MTPIFRNFRTFCLVYIQISSDVPSLAIISATVSCWHWHEMSDGSNASHILCRWTHFASGQANTGGIAYVNAKSTISIVADLCLFIIYSMKYSLHILNEDTVSTSNFISWNVFVKYLTTSVYPIQRQRKIIILVCNIINVKNIGFELKWKIFWILVLTSINFFYHLLIYSRL